MKKNKLICRNCGKPNHHIRDCYEPKTSFGIILYKFIDRKLKILLIKRRNTLGFVQFVRGQYLVENISYIQKLFNVMTNVEIEIIKNKSFDFLWRYLWKEVNNNSHRASYDYSNSLMKYNKLIRSRVHNIDFFINNKFTNYEDQEWGFPKGRKNKSENNIETAIREFTEETGIPNDKIKLIKKKKFIENYVSYDNIEYKNIYFLAKYMGTDYEFCVSEDHREQYSEVSSINFFEVEQAYSIIRNYSIKKKKIVHLVNNYINKYL